MQNLPFTNDLAALSAVATANAIEAGENGLAGPITYIPGGLTPVSGGSLTDSDGNTWTLPLMSSWPAGTATENGQSDYNDQWTAALGLENGHIVAESAKSGQWWQASNGGWSPIPTPADATSGGMQFISDPSPQAPVASTTASTSNGQGPGGEALPGPGGSWTLTSAGVVEQNGVPVYGGAGTDLIAVTNDNQVFGHSASGGWFTYSTDTNLWTSVPNGPG